MDWQSEQLDALGDAVKHHPTAHVRMKAGAVLAVANGATHKQAAKFYHTSQQSVGQWVRRFREGGIEGFEIAPGRGRPRQVDQEQLVDYALQSPRNFGLNRSRWTLRTLAEVVPSLKGFSDSGVLKALRRVGISYKRGQAWMSSPDPDFEKKARNRYSPGARAAASRCGSGALPG